MSVKKLGDELCSLLHRTQLKSNGFKKNGRTYFRDRGDFVEHFNIQGSSWNSGEEPWHFYVNVMVALKDIVLTFDGAPSKYHASGRLEFIISTAPGVYDLTRSNLEAIAVEIAADILAASEAIPRFLRPVRARAARGYCSPLPVPETWAQA
jgi:hypothetical protein